MHAAAFTFIIELIGNTRHLSKREEAVDAIAAACDLIPRLNAMKFSGAPTPEHEAINRVHVGVVHGALGHELHEWRPPQVADYRAHQGLGPLRAGPNRSGSAGGHAPRARRAGGALPRPQGGAHAGAPLGRPTMPPFEVARNSRIVAAVNRAYREVRGGEQPTGPSRRLATTAPTPGICLFRRHGGHRLRPRRPLQHHARRARRHRRFLDVVRIYMLAILDICG